MHRQSARVLRRAVTMIGVAALAAVGLVMAPAAASAVDALGVCVPAGSGASRIAPGAVFVLPDRMQKDDAAHSRYDQADWDALLGELQQSGFESVIVQFTARTDDHTGAWGVYFPGNDLHSPRATGGKDRSVVLGYILAAARTTGMTVTIGLGLDEAGWFAEGWQESSWIAAETDRAIATADRIWETYGDEYGDLIDGWYLPYEVEGYDLTKNIKDSPSETYGDRLKSGYVDSYLAEVSEHVVGLSGKDRVIVSPLFTAASSPAMNSAWLAAWTDFWAYVYDTTAVTVVAPQDGRGSGKNTVAAVTQWFQATTAARDQAAVAGTEVWGNAEVYRDQNEHVKVMPITMLAENLQAMRNGGASRMVSFSAITFDAVAGHHGAAHPARQGFAAAYRAWATGAQCPGSSGMTAPGAPVAVTGADAGESDGDGFIDTNVTLSWDPSQTGGGAARAVVAYQIRRDGRLIGETGPSVSPSGRVEFTDYQQQPGRTLVYTIRGYDAWGVFSPVSTQAVVTIPWTSAAMETNPALGFNLARNAPFTVTSTADQPGIGPNGLGKPAAGTTVAAGSETGKYGDQIDPLAAEYTWGNGPLTDGLLGTDNTYDGRWQALVQTGHMQNWVMKFQLNGGAGAPVRQVNTQWRHHPAHGASAPEQVTVKARTVNGTMTTLGVFSRADLIPGGQNTVGTYWHTVTAPQELPNVSEIWLEVVSPDTSQVFMGELQAFDNQQTNHALGQKYQFFPYSSSAEYSSWATGLRAWTLTDGVVASSGSQSPGWSGRNMTTLGINKLFITLDLGAVSPIESVAFGSLQSGGESVGVPASWRVRTASADGVWGGWAAGEPPSTSPAGRRTFALEHEVAARYVQLELTRRSTAQWLFIDEVEVGTTATANIAVERPVILASNTPALLPAGATPGCAQPGPVASLSSCNRTANDVQGLLSGLTSTAPYPVEWNQASPRWAMTKHYDYLLDEAGTQYGATYEIDLEGSYELREITSTWLEDYQASLTLPRQVTASYLTPDGQWKSFSQPANRPATYQEIPQEMFTWTYRHARTVPVTATKIRIQAANGTLKPWEGNTITSMATARITAHEAIPE